MEEHKKEILELLLRNGSNSPVILGGVEMGTASWMARQIIESATTSQGFCSESLWVSLAKNYDTRWLYKTICDQLSSGSIPEEWEYEEDANTELKITSPGLKVNTVDWEQEEKENQNAEQEAEEETTIDNLKLKIQKQLDKRKPVLLVLDCEGHNMDDNEFKQNILLVLSSINHEHLKIIITRCVARGGDAIQEQIEVGPLSPDDSLSFLKERVGEQRVSKIPDFNIQFSDAIKEKTSMHWPAAITVIAGTLVDIAGYDALKNALQKAVYYEKPCQDGVNPLISYAYNMMQSDITKNCFWHSLQFVRNFGGVHYNELITHWIMEGYFDPFDHVEKAYQAGHLVLMELIDRAMLKMQENNIVVVEGAALNMIDTRHGFYGTASLGLVRVFKNGEGFGRVTHIDGMIKTLCNPKNVNAVSTLLIDGAHPNRELHEEFFSSMSGLKLLAVFNSGYKPLISTLSGLKDLDVLVLRNCDLLDDTTHISNLRTLRVLEISNSRAGEYSSLMSMPENLFDEMTQLQSLNLSGLQIESLPSLSRLIKLRLLILRRCSRMKKLQSLKGLANLEILDLSGSESFENFHESFSEIPKFQLMSMPENLSDEMTQFQSLHLSGLQIESLPSLSKLRLLILRQCSRLKKLQSLKGLANLEILDLSGSESFENFYDTSFSEIPNIQLIDFSHTKIQKLPVFGELKHLTRILLRGCSNKLRQLPRLQHLASLQILDLSGASEFRNFMFKDLIAELNHLKVLNLSKTKISKLPPIPCNLSELNLSGCSELVELPSTTFLKNLELLDVSDTPKLAKINHESFQVSTSGVSSLPQLLEHQS